MAHSGVDVVILGGGPAGSTAATLLARAGIDTLVVEEQSFPRFHVGESLLPHQLPLLDELGVHDAVRALPHTRVKEGASFLSQDGARGATYWFDRALPPAIPHAYQVRRDELDALLLATAAAAGAQVLHDWRATAPVWDAGRLSGVRLQARDGTEREVACRVLLDASGQTSFLASRMGWRFPYPRHRKIAAFSHFEGVALPGGRAAGNTSVVLTDGGWFWLIPFADDTVSVGAVLDLESWRGQPGGPKAVFEAAAAATPAVTSRLLHATPVRPFETVSNFSYRVMRLAGDGFCLIGDAGGFLDPVFSTGVFIATVTAASAAEDVREALSRHNRVERLDMAPTVALTRSLHRLFFSFIRAYYDPHFLPFLFQPEGPWKLPEAMVSLLAADVLRPGRWHATLRFRALLGLSWLQQASCRLGRPLVPPIESGPASRRRAA